MPNRTSTEEKTINKNQISMRNLIRLTCIRVEVSASSRASEIPDVLYPNMAAIEYMFMRLLYIDLYSDLEMCVCV